jgi:hypothetical protein
MALLYSICRANLKEWFWDWIIHQRILSCIVTLQQAKMFSEYENHKERKNLKWTRCACPSKLQNAIKTEELIFSYFISRRRRLEEKTPDLYSFPSILESIC